MASEWGVCWGTCSLLWMAVMPASGEVVKSAEDPAKGRGNLITVSTAEPEHQRQWVTTDVFSRCKGDCAITLLVGQSVSETRMTDIFLHFKPPSKWKWDDTYIAGITFSRSLLQYRNLFSIEPETGIAIRFGAADGFEAWAGLLFRWKYFPWNDYLRTSLGIVWGGSFSRDVSFQGNHLKSGQGTHLVSYFAPEVTFGVPSEPRWDLVIRYHHRSNVWGVLSEKAGDSQFWTIGGRVRF